MPSTKISGLEILKKYLNNLDKVITELSETKSVTLGELFTSPFMQKYTVFSSLDGLLNAGGFRTESQEDFENIPADLLDKHIAATTKFKNWEEMLSEAATQ